VDTITQRWQPQALIERDLALGGWLELP